MVKHLYDCLLHIFPPLKNRIYHRVVYWQIFKERKKMTEAFETQIRHLLSNPDMLKTDTENRDTLIRNMEMLINGKEPTIRDLQSIAAAADLDFKLLLVQAALPVPYIAEGEILQRIKANDLESLLLITSVNILRKDRKFYILRFNGFNETNCISAETMEKLREFFLKNGHPLAARRISTTQSYYCPKSLNDMICTLDDMKLYLFGTPGLKAPYTDSLTIRIFNRLNKHDQDTILTWLLDSYRKLENVQVYDTFITVSFPGEDMVYIINRADFDELETDSPKKAELIALQDQYFPQK